MKNSKLTLHMFENKLWFRFLKLIYVLGFLISSIIIISIFAKHYSDKIIVSNKTTISCNAGNKKEFNAGTEKFNFTYSTIEPYHVNLTHDDTMKINQLCQTSLSENSLNTPQSIEATPYNIKPDIRTNGKTLSYWMSSLIYLMLNGIVFEIIKKAFFKVVFLVLFVLKKRDGTKKKK